MKVEDCILVSENNEQIKCKYYEIEEKCVAIIESKRKEDPNLENQFQEFRKKYTYFNPYFDFVLCVLKYKIYNPLDLADACLYGKEDEIHLFHLNMDHVLCPINDDAHIGLYNPKKEELRVSLIDENGLGIGPKGTKHNYIARFILNQFFIKDENLYRTYLEKRENFYFFSYANFLIYYKPFLSLEVKIKDKKTAQFAMFANREINYELVGLEENVTKEQQAWISEKIEEGVLKQEDIHISEKKKARLF